MDRPRAYPRRTSPGSRASAGDLFPRAFTPAAVVCSSCDSTKRSASTAAACCIFSKKNRIWRSGRVVEGDGLENRSASKGRQGFESLLLLSHGNPGRVRFALRSPTRHHLPARFPLRGLRDLHLPHHARSLRSRPRARPRQTRALAPGLAAAAAAASPWAKPACADAIDLTST